MPNENEGIDLQNDEVTTTEQNEETQEREENAVDWEAKAKELEGRLKRAETKLKRSSESKGDSKPSTSGGLDYGQKAFLHANGIKGAEEIKYVEKELAESGKSLEELLENKYFKSGLEDLREISRSEDASLKGKRTGTTALDSVEYWMNKPLEEVPKEMRTKVVNAQLAKEKSGGVFYNS